MDSARVERLRQVRTTLRARAAGELARRRAAVAACDMRLAAVRDAETRARDATSARDLGLAFRCADGLARRATVLAAQRTRALAATAEAQATLEVRRRDEAMVARLAARLDERAAARARAAESELLDELALGAYARLRRSRARHVPDGRKP